MIVGVKGLKSPYGKNSVTKITDKIEECGCVAKEFRYVSFGVGHTYLLEKIFSTQKRLYKVLSEGDSILAHSFGGVLTTDLLTYMESKPKKLKNIYMLNPSVDWDIRIPEENFDNMFIFYEPEDRMLRLAQWLPFNKLGALGKHGYRYPSDKIHNIRIRPGKTTRMKHDGAFFEPNLTYYSEFVTIVETGTREQVKQAIEAIKNFQPLPTT